MFLKTEKKKDNASLKGDQSGNVGKSFKDDRPEAAAQNKITNSINISPQIGKATQLQSMIDASPRMVAQRKQNEQIFGKPVQRKKDKEEEKPLQKKVSKEEENVAQLAEDKDKEVAKKKRLAEIEAKYRAMIQSSRDKGYNVAANMLQRFLDGTMGTATLDVGWLRGFSEITEAEKTNHGRFEKSLTDKAYTLNDGDSVSFSDHWDRMLTSSVLKELYYASGTSTLSSKGNFTLSRKGNIITISGAVDQLWHDPYDWHGGLGAYIPGHGYISDDDALFLQDYGKARSFNMESKWKQNLYGTVEIINWWPDSVNYDWKGP